MAVEKGRRLAGEDEQQAPEGEEAPEDTAVADREAEPEPEPAGVS